MNDDKEDQFEEEFSNEQTKIANNENVGTKATAIKRHLKFILSGSGMAISIIFLILIKLISTFFPTPIDRQAESGTWYTGFIRDTGNLEEVFMRVTGNKEVLSA